MVQLIQFPRYKNFPNMSPYCVKIETYLKMAEISYECKYTFRPQGTRKQKLPIIKHEGKLIEDSTFIIDYLVEKFGDKVDFHLSAEQRVQSWAFQKMIEDELIPAGIYFRWVDEKGWLPWKEKIFARMPLMIRWFGPPKLHKEYRRRTWSHGIGRHSRDEIFQLMDKTLAAVSAYLGDKTFFFNDRPSTLDAVCFGVIGNFLNEDCARDLPRWIGRYPNLAAHTERMLKKYYGSGW